MVVSSVVESRTWSGRGMTRHEPPPEGSALVVPACHLGPAAEVIGRLPGHRHRQPALLRGLRCRPTSQSRIPLCRATPGDRDGVLTTIATESVSCSGNSASTFDLRLSYSWGTFRYGSLPSIRCLRFRNMTCEASLVLVGDDPLLCRLQHQAQGFSRIWLLSFVNHTAIPLWYGAADIMVMPSEDEPRGLAVNEAVAAGAVTSRAVGAAPGLVTRDSGRTFQVGDIEQLVNKLDELAGKRPLRETLRQGGQAVLPTFTLDHAAAGIEDGALQACGAVPS